VAEVHSFATIHPSIHPPACLRDSPTITNRQPQVRDYLRGLLGLMRSNHPEDCMTCDANGRCEFQTLITKYQVRGLRWEVGRCRVGGVDCDLLLEVGKNDRRPKRVLPSSCACADDIQHPQCVLDTPHTHNARSMRRPRSSPSCGSPPRTTAKSRRTTVRTTRCVLCCAVLCCAVLCCAVLCCAVLCYAVLFAALCFTPCLLGLSPPANLPTHTQSQHPKPSPPHNPEPRNPVTTTLSPPQPSPWTAASASSAAAAWRCARTCRR